MDHHHPAHSEASSKKSRKPYTLTKARESWSNDEHERFIKALQLYNRDWKKIETYVGTKTVVQIRSHAQKYFQKIMKFGITDAIPPPRPKRRASDPPASSAAAGGGGTDAAAAKHMRLGEAPSRPGSGRDDESDETLHLHQQHQTPLGHAGASTQQQQHHNAAAAATQQQQQQQQHQHQQQHHHQQQHQQQPQQHHHYQQQHHHQQQQQHPDLLEPSAQLESSRSLVGSQGLQHVYLLMASLFSQPQADLAAMLPRLSTRDRSVLAVLLKSLVEELHHQQQHAHPPHTQHSMQLQDDEHTHQHSHQERDEQQLQQQQPHSGSNGLSNGATGGTSGPAPGDDAAGAAAGDGQAVPAKAASEAAAGAAATAGQPASGCEPAAAAASGADGAQQPCQPAGEAGIEPPPDAAAAATVKAAEPLAGSEQQQQSPGGAAAAVPEAGQHDQDMQDAERLPQQQLESAAGAGGAENSRAAPAAAMPAEGVQSMAVDEPPPPGQPGAATDS